ncbi:hypothetical protein [Microbacterium tumbae]
MSTTNEAHNGPAAYDHEDFDHYEPEPTGFEPDGLANDEFDRYEAVSAPEGRLELHGAGVEPVIRRDTARAQEHARTDEVSALARHRDPSMAAEERRARLRRQVRDRAGARWVPASELIRHGTARVAGTSMDVQMRVHRGIRNGMGRAVVRAGRTAQERARRLGQPRPLQVGANRSAARTAAGL